MRYSDSNIQPHSPNRLGSHNHNDLSSSRVVPVHCSSFQTESHHCCWSCMKKAPLQVQMLAVKHWHILVRSNRMSICVCGINPQHPAHQNPAPLHNRCQPTCRLPRIDDLWHHVLLQAQSCSDRSARDLHQRIMTQQEPKPHAPRCIVLTPARHCVYTQAPPRKNPCARTTVTGLDTPCGVKVV